MSNKRLSKKPTKENQSGIIQVSVFGALDVRKNQQPVHLSITGTTRSLLQFLLCNHERLSRREKLMEAFWPDTRVDRRRSSLNSAIWRIKKGLVDCAPITLDATAECVRLTGLHAPKVKVDFISLEAAIQSIEHSDTTEAPQLNQLMTALAQCEGEP